jgi:hypothetical protein
MTARWIGLSVAMISGPVGCASAGANARNDAGGPVTSPRAPVRDAAVPPGKTFDLSIWELQEPVGDAGAPNTIGSAALQAGYEDAYFFTDPTDGAMTFWDPENGVTTANSSYPRSELRELNTDGSPANWSLAGTHALAASVAVTAVPDHVCVGQIHLGSALDAGLAASTKPLLELYVYANGDIDVGIENDPTGGQTSHFITNVPLGTRFDYAVQITGAAAVSVTIDGATSSYPLPAAFTGYGQYFKAGDYDQTAGSDGTVGATVKFYALSVSHAPG